MPSAFETWCMETFGRMPATFTEIYYAGRWFERDREAARLAATELESIATVDDLLKIGR